MTAPASRKGALPQAREEACSRNAEGRFLSIRRENCAGPLRGSACLTETLSVLAQAKAQRNFIFARCKKQHDVDTSKSLEFQRVQELNKSSTKHPAQQEGPRWIVPLQLQENSPSSRTQCASRFSSTLCPALLCSQGCQVRQTSSGTSCWPLLLTVTPSPTERSLVENLQWVPRECAIECQILRNFLQLLTKFAKNLGTKTPQATARHSCGNSGDKL